MEEPGFTSFMYLSASSLSVVMAISNSVPFWNTWAWSATAGLVVWISPMAPKIMASSTNGNDSKFSNGTKALNSAIIPSTSPATARPDVGFFSIVIPFFS